ncbi:MAG: GNAT family N-acetyltransferase [Hyphomicrobium sp.]
MRARILKSLAHVSSLEWDQCANPNLTDYNPFISHAYLIALETSGCVGPKTGWIPQHILLEDENDHLIACMAVYIKLHSMGEYVFDSAFAEAYQSMGGQYYPKLQAAVPFTPVTGRRLFIKSGIEKTRAENFLIDTALGHCRTLGASSFHITFSEKEEWDRLGQMGLLQRCGQQFHWLNENYKNFEEFLQTLSSRKRKMMRKEREGVLKEGIEIEHVTGSEIKEYHWESLYEFYLETSSRKWGRPYLNREFFSEIGATLNKSCLLIFASRAGQRIAGALHLLGGNCLYGRYWGALENIPFLHFELCYYQAIDYAICHGLKRVEAGAQGEHKLLRGYIPTTTYSSHWFADPILKNAVQSFLEKERRAISESNQMLNTFTPFKKK